VTEQHGRTWVYESIVGALPGIDLSDAEAIALQVVLFEAAVLVLGGYYGLWQAALAGTAAIGVAAVGSYAMLRLGQGNRRLAAPEAHYRLLFGSNVEVVLAVLAFVALVTHLFVFDPRGGDPLVARLFGPEPPVAVVYLTLLVLWDLCYRIGAAWWASVVSLWRALRVPLDGENRALARRLDLTNVGFAVTQLLLVPFLLAEPVLLAAVLGHVLAVATVSGTALLLS